MELLDFARGPALTVSIYIFILGVLWRLAALLLMPRMRNPTKRREGAPGEFMAGVKAVFSRFGTRKTFMKRAALPILNGYVFHIGLAIVVFFFVPHILFFQDWLGISWPGLPNLVIYAAGVATLVSLLVALARRIFNPVMRMLSTADDYISWLVTFLPVLTGLMATAHLGPRYEIMLAIHILTVCALLIWLPFGKLMHTFLFIASRAVSGARFAHRGAKI